MNQENAVSFVAATLIAQYALILIMFVGAFVLARGRVIIPWYRDASPKGPDGSFFSWLILANAISTTGFLVFCSEFQTAWSPVWGNISFPLFSFRAALLVMFAFDILCISFLIARTGGSQSSPFVSPLLILPAIAIFLGESYGRILLYVFLIVIAHALCMTWLQLEEVTVSKTTSRWAHWLIVVACLLLTTLIAYVTKH